MNWTDANHFLKNTKLLKLTQEETDNQNSPISIIETESGEL